MTAISPAGGAGRCGWESRRPWAGHSVICWRTHFRQLRPSLARGPVHLAAAEQVQVEMIDGLASVGAGVDGDAIALAEVLLAGKLLRDGVQVSDKELVG